MTRSLAPRRGGIAGVLFLFCFAALAAGLAFDLGLGARSAFWIGARAGAAAAFGAGAAVFAILAAHTARTLLRRRPGREETAGGGDAGRHA